MRQFEKCNKYGTEDIKLPTRATFGSAGYDFYAREDIKIPSFFKQLLSSWKYKDKNLNNDKKTPPNKFVNVLNNINSKIEPTIVGTGIKAKMENDDVLLIINRSSGALKRKLLLSNGIGVIDKDYYDTDNEIGFMFWNFSPFSYTIKKGDKIGQGIFTKILRTDDDKVENIERTGGYGSTDEQS